MLHTFAVSNYRSLRDIKLALAPLTIITGANGSGKSNLYRALQLLQHAAQGDLAEALALQGGIASAQWAGPADIRSQAKRGMAIQGTRKNGPLRVTFGFASEDFAYEIALGLPKPSDSLFSLDPEIKTEAIWQKPPRRRANTWLDREGPRVGLRDRDEQWVTLGYALPANRSILADLGEPERFPEVFALRERVRRWRFYDGFRTDSESSLRHPRVSVQTGALAHDGRDVAAALQTILEIGLAPALHSAVADAFDGAAIDIVHHGDARLQVGLRVEGLLRTLSALELSDGTLRYLCLLAALLSPRPPALLVLNEPEQSLHPDLLLPLAKQIVAASARSQVWVISHAHKLVADLEDAAGIGAVELEREFGETRIKGQRMLDEPVWP
jgi:predicted ATPase